MSNVKKILLTTLLSMPTISLFSSLGTTPNSLPPVVSDQASKAQAEAQDSGSMAITSYNASETNAEEQHVSDLMNLPTEPIKEKASATPEAQHVRGLMNLPTESTEAKAPAKPKHSDQSSTAAPQEPTTVAQDLHSSQVVHPEPAKLEVVHTAAHELGSKIASSDSVREHELKFIHSDIKQNTKDIETLKIFAEKIMETFDKFSIAIEEAKKAFRDIKNS